MSSAEQIQAETRPATEAALSVRHLVKDFPVRGGLVFDRAVAYVRAVAGRYGELGALLTLFDALDERAARAAYTF